MAHAADTMSGVGNLYKALERERARNAVLARRVVELTDALGPAVEIAEKFVRQAGGDHVALVRLKEKINICRRALTSPSPPASSTEGKIE